METQSKKYKMSPDNNIIKMHILWGPSRLESQLTVMYSRSQ